MFLCDRERISAADFGHLNGFNAFRAGNSHIWIRGCSQEIAVKPSLLSKTGPFLQIAAGVRKLDKLRHFARPTERDRHRIVSVTGRYKRRDDKLSLDRRPGRALYVDCNLQ